MKKVYVKLLVALALGVVFLPSPSFATAPPPVVWDDVLTRDELPKFNDKCPVLCEYRNIEGETAGRPSWDCLLPDNGNEGFHNIWVVIGWPLESQPLILSFRFVGSNIHLGVHSGNGNPPRYSFVMSGDQLTIRHISTNLIVAVLDFDLTNGVMNVTLGSNRMKFRSLLACEEPVDAMRSDFNDSSINRILQEQRMKAAEAGKSLNPAYYGFRPAQKEEDFVLVNPVRDEIVLRLAPDIQGLVYASVFSADGRLLETHRLAAEQLQHRLPASHLTPGLYWLRIRTPNGQNQVLALVKQ